MQPLLTRAQMQDMDRHAIEELGLPGMVLMEVAGRAVADAAEALARTESIGAPGTVAFLCLAGTGNNGGDAVVAARHLHERGHPVTVVVAGDPERLSVDARAQLDIVNRLGLETLGVDGDGAPDRVADLLPAHAVVVDGLFGLGLDRPIEGWRRRLVERVDAEAEAVVAVDVPSGVNADTGAVMGAAIAADVTVSFQYPKLAHALFPGRTLCGRLVVVDIGIPRAHLAALPAPVQWMEPEDLATPPRLDDAHKGSFGHLLVLAGVPDRPGAALLAARAGARAGAGLVTVGSDRETVARLGPALLELMGASLGDTRIEPAAAGAALEGRTACLVGPSLPPDEATRSLVLDVLGPRPIPLVLDAGALAALGTASERLRARAGPTVLTPHPGEAAALLGLDHAAAVQEDRVGAARRLVERTGAVVVLKGAATVVATPSGEASLSARGGPGLATAGTGDVLAGVIGGLLAQGVEAGEAARVGVELHGLAGDRATAGLGPRAVVASDLLGYLAEPRDDAERGR